MTSTTGHGRAPGRRGDLRPHRRSPPPARSAGCTRHLDECALCARRPCLAGGDPRPARHPAGPRDARRCRRPYRRGACRRGPADSTASVPRLRGTRDRRSRTSATANRMFHVKHRRACRPAVRAAPRLHAPAPGRTGRRAAGAAGSPSWGPSSPCRAGSRLRGAVVLERRHGRRRSGPGTTAADDLLRGQAGEAGRRLLARQPVSRRAASQRPADHPHATSESTAPPTTPTVARRSRERSRTASGRASAGTTPSLAAEQGTVRGHGRLPRRAARTVRRALVSPPTSSTRPV